VSADLYPRPSRDVIAAKVHGQLPGAGNAADDPDATVTRREPAHDGTDYIARFAQHMKGRMRALGWTTAVLIERSRYSQPTVNRALNGTGVALDIAAGLADAVGSSLPAMLIPYQCGTCHGEPPAGFSCLECGTERRPA
jgi:hypothetical protein